MRPFRLAFGLVIALPPCIASAAALDLAEAEVVLAASPTKAADFLTDEVFLRTGIQLPLATSEARSHGPTIVLSVRQPGEPAGAADGFELRTLRDGDRTVVQVVGNDARGLLFGVGRLLRLLDMRPGELSLPDHVNFASSPRYALRGHQLGYRPKTNSYDAWDLPQWEQYYRDLIVFGANAVELVPPNTDDAPTSPHFPRPQLEMMAGMSRLADAYELDVWIWYPAMAKDYANAATVEAELREWHDVFAKLDRIDAVFVPGGDPGHTQPKHLLAYLERAKEVLRRSHPEAQMWVSPQSFSQAWLDEFIAILRTEEPAWLDGVVFGPQVRISLAELRQRTPKRYPIRHYPDITHSRQCQYPVPDWDVAFAVTHGRECINPRPLDQATIFRVLQPHTLGFLTYSEGCNDDVNKTVWSALGWDPDTAVIDALRDYAGYFIGADYRDSFAQGLLALERNWRAPLIANEQVETTLQQFQAMERSADQKLLANWRFQQALYRAYYDAYQRRRLLHAAAGEVAAMAALGAAEEVGAIAAMDAAEAALEGAEATPAAAELRARIVELAEALFQSIGMQSSVAKHQAIHVGRGATLDTVDYPLNNRLWLRRRFAELRTTPDDSARLQGLREIVEWTNPGPGGFYDDLGNAANQPHLVVGPGFERDPAFLRSAHAGFAGPDQPTDADPPGTERWRMSWIDHAESMNDEPLVMRFDGLDTSSAYRLRVVYAGDGREKKIRLQAGGDLEIHPLIEKPSPIRPMEFPIPREATSSGQLTLEWFREPGRGDNGRGCQVAEVWLIKETSPGAK